MLEALSTAVKKLFGDANEREVRKLRPLVAKINSLEAKMQAMDDAELARQTVVFKERLDAGASLDDLHAEAFATVREVAVRTMGMRHYDCQLIGGSVIHQGRIAEMKTGEGKTLVATLPAYLNALEGKGVHLVTVNDYLAERDAEWMSPVYRFLGMEVGVVLSTDRSQRSKRQAYAADITYGTNNEFGFDYLRDNMKYSLEEYVQRGHRYAIIDEIDSILIDEARTPLIISGPAQSSIELYQVVDAVVPLLQRDRDFVIDEKGRSATLTEEGIARIEDRLGVDNLYDPTNIEVLHHTMQSLKAHHLFKRNRDYVVEGSEVVIVDEFTGRKMAGRRWSDGLHQAVEAKEKLPVQPESQTYATITYQNLFRMYDKLSGMTGTALTEAAEFSGIYELDCVAIPTNKPVARADHEDLVYLNQNGKFNAVLEDIRDAHERGQPVLVGTTSVEKSELVGRLLRQAGIPHEVLNAKQHDREATIVAQAGRLGAVTISTNMAGRGTDIKLGGNPEAMAAAEVDPETAPEEHAALFERYKVQCAEEAERVKEAGGLHIIGTERHESRRVDNQLRGRSGRQGDPGSSRFFVGLDDPLMKMFASDRVVKWMEMMGLKEDEAIEAKMVTNAIENAQKKVEGYHFGIRKNILEYDDVMNYQRKGVYDLRRRALEGDGIREMVDEALENTVGDLMDDYADEGLGPEAWNLVGLRANLERVFGITWDDTDEAIRDYSRKELEDRIRSEARALLDAKVADLGEELFGMAGRQLLLQLTDDLWKDHLLAIDRLRQGVHLRSYGSRNPLLEYKREAYQMFLMMSAVRDEQLLTRLLRAQPAAAQQAAEQEAARRAPQPARPQLNFPNLPAALPAAPAAPALPEKGEAAVRFALEHGVGRNDPCPCGSGLKHKKCCGDKATIAAVKAALEAEAAAAPPADAPAGSDEAPEPSTPA